MAKKKQTKVETLNEINEKARAAGMTYGKYLAYMQAKAAAEERQRKSRVYTKGVSKATAKAAKKEIIVPEKFIKAQIERRRGV